MKVTGEEILKDQVVNVKQAELLKQVKWTVQNIHKGHTLFEIDLTNYTIKEAEYEKVDVHLKRIGDAANYKEVKRKIIQKPNCIYISALNKNNALKKFQKQAKNYK
jgi:hypothetical protein